MKKLILLIVGLALAVPSSASAILPVKRSGEIEKDKSGGYSHDRLSPQERRANDIKLKTGAGYRNGHYCGTGEKYKKDEWQFVDPSHCGGSAPKDSHKAKDKSSKKKVENKEKKTQAPK